MSHGSCPSSAGVLFKDIISLGNSLRTIRTEGRTSPIKIELYVGAALATELTMDPASLYIVGFRGVDREYDVSEFGGENYNALGMPTVLTLADLNRLTALGTFTKGVSLDKSLIAIAAIVVAEAARFQAVHMYIQGLLSYTFTSIPLAELDKRYFKEWAKTTKKLTAGEWTPGSQIVVDVRHIPKKI